MCCDGTEDNFDDEGCKSAGAIDGFVDGGLLASAGLLVEEESVAAGKEDKNEDVVGVTAKVWILGPGFLATVVGATAEFFAATARFLKVSGLAYGETQVSCATVFVKKDPIDPSAIAGMTAFGASAFLVAGELFALANAPSIICSLIEDNEEELDADRDLPPLFAGAGDSGSGECEFCSDSSMLLLLLVLLLLLSKLFALMSSISISTALVSPFTPGSSF